MFFARLTPLLLVLSQSALAFNPTGLHCSLSNQNFSTEINFSLNQKQQLCGELDNYVLKNGKKQFLSGALFFDVMAKADSITGHTGDPRGVISNFSLTDHSSRLNGVWIYKSVDPNGRKTQGLFDCLYDSNE